MLYRDADWRDKQRHSPNVRQLIGQHCSRSTIQDPWRPFETQDFRKALQSVDTSSLLGMKHKSWMWGRGRTWKYLRLHSLGFDQHGVLVRKTGRLDGDLMERFLLPQLPITTGEQAIVLRSSGMTASIAENRACAAAYNESAPRNRTTDYDYVGSHDLPHRGSPDLGTAIVREDVSYSSDDVGRSVLEQEDGIGTFPGMQQSATAPYFIRSEVMYPSEKQADHDTIQQFTWPSLDTGNRMSGTGL
jgi:hypothetical protein